MKFAFILARAVAFPVALMCQLLGVSKSGFYAWRDRPESARSRDDARLAIDVAAVHKRSRGRYGSPRVHAELQARGISVGRKRVERLMREQGLRARRRRRFRKTTDSQHANPIAPNLLERNFEATAPNQVWVTDVTYVSTHEGWLYLAVIVDLYARRVVGWAASEANDTTLALAALSMAVERRRPPRGLVHHSDRGSPLGFKRSSQRCPVGPSIDASSALRRESATRGFFAADC